MICVDLLKGNAQIKQVMTRMSQIIIYMNGHSKVVGLIRDAQRANGVNAPLVLLNTAITRWSSHYLAARRLLQLEATVKQVAGNPDMIPKARKQKAAARKIISYIQDSTFWVNLKDTSRILMPIAGLCYVLQRRNLRLDTMFLAFSKVYKDLYKLANDPMSSSLTVSASNLVLKTLEKRWKPLDHELILSTLILNPFNPRNPSCLFGTSVFGVDSTDPIVAMLERVEKRLFPGNPSPRLAIQYFEYMTETGRYGDGSRFQNVARDLTDESAEKVSLKLINYDVLFQ